MFSNQEQLERRQQKETMAPHKASRSQEAIRRRLASRNVYDSESEDEAPPRRVPRRSKKTAKPAKRQTSTEEPFSSDSSSDGFSSDTSVTGDEEEVAGPTFEDPDVVTSLPQPGAPTPVPSEELLTPLPEVFFPDQELPGEQIPGGRLPQDEEFLEEEFPLEEPPLGAEPSIPTFTPIAPPRPSATGVLPGLSTGLPFSPGQPLNEANPDSPDQFPPLPSATGDDQITTTSRETGASQTPSRTATSESTSSSPSPTAVTGTLTSASASSSSTSISVVHEAAHKHASSSSSVAVEATSAAEAAAATADERGMMSPDLEHALISVGSIGSFIFVSFFVWIIWRTIKRSKARKHQRHVEALAAQGLPPPPPPASGPGFAAKLFSRVPFLRDRLGNRTWENLDRDSIRDLPPSYEKSGPPGQLRLQTSGFYSPDAKGYASQQGVAPTFVSPQADMYQSPATVSPVTPVLGRSDTNMTLQQQQQQQQQQQLPQQYMGTIRTVDSNGTMTSIFNNYVYTYGSSSFDPSLATMNSQTSNAYGQSGQQQTRQGRASAISSLSSGFGDGDIIVAAASAAGGAPNLQPPAPVAAPASQRSTPMAIGRFSWNSQSTSSPSNRETVYTETSEDSPPRFRSVSSWVNQQTGRVKRAHARGDEEAEIPPVPGIPPHAMMAGGGMPPEQHFTMMMPDGEEPRRAEGYEGGNSKY